MTTFVLDASVTLAWCFEDEATEATWELLDRVSHDGAFIPQLWSLEVGNILVRAAQRERTTAARIALFIEQLHALPLRVDDETASRGLAEILALAQAESLTTYDAAYLELAMRRGLPLATKDTVLAEAAARKGIELLPVR